jgi:hypothetical protein
MRTLLPFICLLAACHTHEVERGDRGMASQAKEGPPRQREINSPRPVRTTPAGFLDDQAVRQIQEALGKKGERVAHSGKLDGPTRAALKRFQVAEHQPPTGFPDFETVRRLGLDAKKLYLGGAERQPIEK